MMLGRRLPVAPRPYRDELLSSWLGRVACRYGLDAASLLGALAADGEGAARGIPIDDAAPPREDTVSWARTCGVDPARLSRLTLARRRPGRPKGWFLSQGPPWAPMASRSPPACCACFEADRAAGRDEYLRADWMLAERCVCPAHLQLLRDRCPCCRGPLHFAFRLRDGRARLVCGECERELAARSAREVDGALLEALISIQDRIGAIVRRAGTPSAAGSRPFDAVGAARRSRRRAADAGAVARRKRLAMPYGGPGSDRCAVPARAAADRAAHRDPDRRGRGFWPRRRASRRRPGPRRISNPARRAAARFPDAAFGAGRRCAGAAAADRISATCARNPDESGVASRRRAARAAARARFVAIDGRRARRAAG